MAIFGGGPTARRRGEPESAARPAHRGPGGETVWDPDPLIDISPEDITGLPGDLYDWATSPWQPQGLEGLEEERERARAFQERMMIDLGYAGPLEGTLDAATFGEAAQLDLGPQGEFRGRQMTLADQLASLGRGEGESIADLQMRAAMERMGQEQRAMAAMAPGGAQRGASLRAAMRGTAQSQQVGARDAAIARAMESLQARQQLAGVLGTGRGQDVTLTTEQARLEQERRRENLRSTLEHRGLSATERADLRRTALGAAGLGMEGAGRIAGSKEAAAAGQRQLVGGAIGAYGGYKAAQAAGGG